MNPRISSVDHLLIEDIREGNEQALETLFLKYYKELCAYGSTITKDPAKTEEIVSDLFYHLWINSAQLSITSNVRAYLYASIKNRCINVLKKSMLVCEVQLAELSEPAYEEIAIADTADDKDERLSKVMQGVQSLPHKRREIFELNRLQGMSYQQIAEQLNLSERTVRNHVFRAMKYLKELSFFILLFSL